jgi:hypothetical protein
MANLYYRRGLFIIISFIFFSVNPTQAATIKGQVIDIQTHENIAGAFVDIVGTKYIFVSDVNGYFIFDELSKGSYTLSAKMMGYKPSVSEPIELNSNDAVVTFNIFKESETNELNNVQVKGTKNNETDVSARLDEKLASNVINIISAKTIEQLPDLNVANVMQRVSGVSMVKNSTGDNTEAIIRGMPPRYSNTMINGTSAPSTSGSTRSVPLDMIPSSLVGRIEVTKALTPDQEANGLGGTVNIEMKDAPANPLFYVDLSSGYNQYFFSHELTTFNSGVVNMKDPDESNLAKFPNYTYQSVLSDFTRPNMVTTIQKPLPGINGNFAFGHRYFHDKLGVLISATVDNTSEGTIDNFYGTQTNSHNSLDINSWNKRNFDTQTMSVGSNVKLDYQLDENNKLSLYNSFLQMTQDGVRIESDTTAEINKGRVGSQVVTNKNISTLNSTNLQGHHHLLNNLDLDWSLIYSIATSQAPDLVTESFVQIIHPTVQPVYLNYDGCVTRQWQHNTDEDKTG